MLDACRTTTRGLATLVFCLLRASPSFASVFLGRSAVKRGNATQSELRALRQTGARSANSVLKAGIEVHFDPAQSWSNWWRSSYPTWETGTFNVFQRFVKDKVVLDVGAWIGPTALWSGHVAKRVVALEPTTEAFTQFSANLAANPELKGKVIAVKAALDSQDRTATMSNTGNSMDKIALIDVRALTIGTLLKEHPELNATGFVKIDTEGYERVIVPALESFFKEKKTSGVCFFAPHVYQPFTSASSR